MVLETMKEDRTKGMRIVRYVLIVFWTILVVGFFLWDLRKTRQETASIASNVARAYFSKDLAFRLWGSTHGGVYVPIDEKTPPNPHLEHVSERDIQTPSGKRLTLMNPAYMVRQLQEEFARLYGVKGHITSLKHFRPETAPDDWERAALIEFEAGRKEVKEFTAIDDEPYLRLMKPLVADKGCLKCHAFQGYKEGDVRGGVSVSLPMKDFLEIESRKLVTLIISLGSIFILGLLGIMLGMGRLERREKERDAAMEALKKAGRELETRVRERTSELDSANRQLRLEIDERRQLETLLRKERDTATKYLNVAGTLIVALDTEGNIDLINRKAFEVLGYQPETMVGSNWFDTVIPERDRDRVKRVFSRVISGEIKSLKYFENSVVTKSGEERLIAWYNTLLTNEAGEILGALSSGEDVTDRRRAEEALRESEERYRAVFHNAGIGIDILDREGRIVQVNQALLDMLGYSEEELLQYTFVDITHPDEKEISKLELEALMAGQLNSYRKEKRYLRKDGCVLWSDLTTTAIRGASGEHLGTIGVIADITERKKAEDARKEIEKRFRAYFDLPIIGIAITSPDKGWIEVNSKLCDILGYSREELSQMTWSELTHPDDLDADIENFERVIRGQIEGYSLEKRFLRKRGKGEREFVWADLAVRCVKKPDGSIDYFVALIQDITKRKETEQSLRRSEELLRTVIGTAPVGITLSVDRNLIWVNDAWKMIFGMGQDRAGTGPGSARAMYATQEEFERVGKLLYEDLGTGRTGESDATMIRQDGTVFDAHIAMKAIDPSDLSKGCIGIIMDMTARKEAEQEKESLRRQLFQSQKMESIGTLTGGIAHDFSNLLTIINGYTELILSEKTEEDPIYSDLQKIIETGRKGAELVQRLLALSKRGEIDPQPLDINQTVESSVALMRRTLPKAIEIETVLTQDLGIINADASQVEQVLMNLSINAKEAMPEGGRLRIETKNVVTHEVDCRHQENAKTGSHVLVEVSDTGGGMDAKTLERSFDPFFTTKGWDFKKGTGLGLSVSKGIVEQHGGWITCESEQGKGTTFRIYFPVIEGTTVADEPSPPPQTVPGAGTILLVDYEEYARDLGQRILERAGYRVITASNGKEALEIYGREQSSIGLVVLDLIMPQMNGEKCLEELLKINRGVKVVVSTGHAPEAREKVFPGAMAKGFVNKPYEVKELLQVVADVL